MKEFLKTVVGRTARNPAFWALYRGCGQVADCCTRIYGHARYSREIHARDEKLASIVRTLFPDLTIVTGPFQGMRYPVAKSYGSMLLPKLIGSYESELHPFLEQLLTNNYSTVVDIGCAEGYYAVGLGLRLASAEIFAFDIASEARRMCKEMAELNGLTGRMHVRGLCDRQALRAVPLGDRALIISDCEGHEDTLFDEETARYLVPHDLIVELHDFIDIDISTRVRRTLSKTHCVKSVRSIDDIQKAHTYNYPQLNGYSTSEKRVILGERRASIMEWLVATARH